METYWVPGVNHHDQYGRWAFAEFNKMIALILNQTATIETHGKEQQT